MGIVIRLSASFRIESSHVEWLQTMSPSLLLPLLLLCVGLQVQQGQQQLCLHRSYC